MVQHVDMVVLVIFAETVGGCFSVYSGHDCRSDDRQPMPAKFILVDVVHLQQVDRID